MDANLKQGGISDYPQVAQLIERSWKAMYKSGTEQFRKKNEKRYYLFSYISEQGANTSSVPWFTTHFGDQLVTNLLIKV